MSLAGIARGDPPLGTADVVRFLRAGISERTILAELQDRGFAETLDPAREAALREAGASETLVVAVRRAAPAEGPPAAPPPAPRASATSAASFGSAGSTAQGPTFAVGTRTVRVPVSVLDRSGRPVTGLRSEDFRVAEDGKRQPVTLFSGERRALRIALALDTSRSMKGKIRRVEEALRHFIDLLEPADEILVITFGDHVRVVSDFTSDRELLGQVLDLLEPAGRTVLYDAAAEAIRRVSKGPAESKAVVLVTDGVDTGSRTSFEDLREMARRSEVPVFSIGLDGGSGLLDMLRPSARSGPGLGRPRFPGGGGRRGPGGRGGWPGGGGRGGWPGGSEPGGGGQGGGPPSVGPSGGSQAGFDRKPLAELADETGGRAEVVKGLDHYTPGTEAPGSAGLKTAVETIALTLRHRYLIGYEPPEGKGGWRSIRVEVDRDAALARARKGYYSPS